MQERRATDPSARGVVVNLLDQKLWNQNPDFFSYTLSKAALEAANTLLAQALAPTLRVCGVAPGVTLASGPMDDAARVLGFARAAEAEARAREAEAAAGQTGSAIPLWWGAGYPGPVIWPGWPTVIPPATWPDGRANFQPPQGSWCSLRTRI